MNFIAEDTLIHEGTKKHSGRYPYGSGKHPYQHSGDFLSRVESMKKNPNYKFTDEKGVTYTGETAIARALGMTTTSLRIQVKTAAHERRQLDYDRARSLKEDGKNNTEIARIMGYPGESSVRSLLNQDTSDRKKKAWNTADILQKEVDKKKMIDIGDAVELETDSGVSRSTFDEALFILKTRGYQTLPVSVGRVNDNEHRIRMKVLCSEDLPPKYPYQHLDEIQSFGDYHSSDNGVTFDKIKYPSSIDSNRVAVRYGDKGGKEKDGTIEIRRGVKDLDLGNSHYAQVRILVDGTHYLKGMALYSDDIPEGKDIVFNTNKKSDVSKKDVFKEISDKSDDNPFGAYIKAGGQSTYVDTDGKKKLSAINKLKEEGEWDKMSKNLSSQFLAKQPMKLIHQQLDLTISNKMNEYEDICSLENETIKRKMLSDFAGSCDRAAWTMKAAALPRQRTQVLLPLTGIKDDEVYAPNYKSGEKVVLVRYPHGGTFELPELKVNNRNVNGKKMIGPNAKDAIGINAKVAGQLSGADFDGDNVVVIPVGKKAIIKTQPELKGLKGFEPKDEYATTMKTIKNKKGEDVDVYYNKYGVRCPIMSEKYKQNQMGVVSNLITDMQLKGADREEMERAVRHSMVVIDAPKHKLDYKQSAVDNNISQLVDKYQLRVENGKQVRGASTLISKHKQDIRIPATKGSGRIDADTGRMVYKKSGRHHINKKGEDVLDTKSAKLLLETDDLMSLSTGTMQENAYAIYGNKLKALANQARKAELYSKTHNKEYRDPEARVKYAKEVSELEARLDVAKRNAPRERLAQVHANSVIAALKKDNPKLADDKDELKKLSQQIISDTRASLGSHTNKIEITDKQWEAIQARAISDSKLEEILRYADADKLKERAMPKENGSIPTAKVNRMKAMIKKGYTNEEIAKALGVSVSTIVRYSDNERSDAS